MSNDVWTSRDVRFRCFPRSDEKALDEFMDSLPDHYWEGWRHRLLGTLGIGSHGDGTAVTFEVGGWPWWVPGWVARRSVAARAQKAGVGGEAIFVVSRTVLP